MRSTISRGSLRSPASWKILSCRSLVRAFRNTRLSCFYGIFEKSDKSVRERGWFATRKRDASPTIVSFDRRTLHVNPWTYKMRFFLSTAPPVLTRFPADPANPYIFQLCRAITDNERHDSSSPRINHPDGSVPSPFSDEPVPIQFDLHR